MGAPSEMTGRGNMTSFLTLLITGRAYPSYWDSDYLPPEYSAQWALLLRETDAKYKEAAAERTIAIVRAVVVIGLLPPCSD